MVVRLATSDDELQVIGNVRPATRVLTPNGDGVNDVTAIAFDLFKLTRATLATVEIFDLGGRRLRLLLHEELGDVHEGQSGV